MFEQNDSFSMFYNRLVKRYKHLSKWARRSGIYAYRLYDKDIPEFPVALDIYHEHPSHKIYTVLTIYESEHRHIEENSISSYIQWICAALNISGAEISIKHRKKQRNNTQYEKISNKEKRITVKEGNCLFWINLSDYLDTGLFLDHRPTRLEVAATAEGKKVLNLFCYTASFSAHALSGGAAHVCSVDLSKKYLSWAKENITLNKYNNSDKCVFIQSDVSLFLKQAQQKNQTWDIIICDPPTFSNSKRTKDFLDINRHWADLIRQCCTVLAKDGILYFSSNSKKLAFSTQELTDTPSESISDNHFMYNGKTYCAENLTTQSIPEDYRNKKIHRLWKIRQAP